MAKVEAGDTPTGASAAVEIELKLCGEPAVLERLWQAPLLRRPGAAAPRVKQLENVYYDTVDLRLPRRGLAFRIRRDGHRFKIGRAPCRERGCTYGSTSVGGVS